MQTNPSRVFSHFPKTRPPLPADIERIYSKHYKSNRDGGTTAASLAQRVEAWMHKKVARDVANGQRQHGTTLEIGAGTLNQLQYEPAAGAYDIIEPFTSLYQDSPLLARIRNIYADISEIPAGTRYDRITSIAAFEHVLNLPEVVARCGLLLAGGGELRTAIPSEGTFLWTLGWKLTTGLEFKMKYGFDYGLLMKHEHVNTASEIREVLEYFFARTESSVLGLAKPISLYQFYACSRPRLDRCRQYSGS